MPVSWLETKSLVRTRKSCHSTKHFLFYSFLPWQFCQTLSCWRGKCLQGSDPQRWKFYKIREANTFLCLVFTAMFSPQPAISGWNFQTLLQEIQKMHSMSLPTAWIRWTSQATMMPATNKQTSVVGVQNLETGRCWFTGHNSMLMDKVWSLTFKKICHGLTADLFGSLRAKSNTREQNHVVSSQGEQEKNPWVIKLLPLSWAVVLWEPVPTSQHTEGWCLSCHTPNSLLSGLSTHSSAAESGTCPLPTDPTQPSL